MTKEYYYRFGKTEPEGPYSLEELQSFHLPQEALIWKKGWKEWQELQKDPNILSSVPEHQIKTESSSLTTKGSEKKNSSDLQKLIIWISIHFFLLITAYTEIDLFSDDKPKQDEFWPFVKILWYREGYWPDHRTYLQGFQEGKWIFNGISYHYDWTEFLVYTVAGCLIFFLRKNKSS